MSDGNGRIHLLDHQSKKTRDEGSKPCTRAQAQAEAVKVVEHYMNQVPGLVAHMLMEAFKAHGFTLQPPSGGEGEPISGGAAGDSTDGQGVTAPSAEQVSAPIEGQQNRNSSESPRGDEYAPLNDQERPGSTSPAETPQEPT